MEKLTVFSLFCLLFAVQAQSYRKNTHVYKEVGSMRIEADVFQPVAVAASYPVVLAFHSGGFLVGNKSEALSERELEDLISRGWVVVTADYRLAPAVVYEDIFEDVVDVYNWVRNDLVDIITGLDVSRFAVFGGSAGGNIVHNAGVYFYPKPSVIIAFYPAVPDFSASYDPTSTFPDTILAELESLSQENIAATPSNPLDFTNRRWAFLLNTFPLGIYPAILFSRNISDTSDNIYARIREYAYILHVNSSYPPTYIVQGANVPSELQQAMLERLLSFNVTAVLDIIQGAPHLFDFQPNSNDYWPNIKKAFDFAQSYLNPSSPSPSPSPSSSPSPSPSPSPTPSPTPTPFPAPEATSSSSSFFIGSYASGLLVSGIAVLVLLN